MSSITVIGCLESDQTIKKTWTFQDIGVDGEVEYTPEKEDAVSDVVAMRFKSTPPFTIVSIEARTMDTGEVLNPGWFFLQINNNQFTPMLKEEVADDITRSFLAFLDSIQQAEEIFNHHLFDMRPYWKDAERVVLKPGDETGRD